MHVLISYAFLFFIAYLALDNNQLSSTIPTELAGLNDLVHLSLHNNWLEGEIPEELGRLSMLDTLTLQGNKLTGRAPSDVCLLRRNELIVFTTDCSNGTQGVVCPTPTCCTECL